MSDQPTMIVIGGPNGAGKTTIALELLPTLPRYFGISEQVPFLNADRAAAEQTDCSPSVAMRRGGEATLRHLASCLANRQSFVYESTLSGRSFARSIRKAKSNGYNCVGVFVWIASAAQSVERVASRVGEGGHNVPVDAIRRRYDRVIRNFFDLYCHLFDEWTLFDNSGPIPKRVCLNLRETYDEAAMSLVLRGLE